MVKLTEPNRLGGGIRGAVRPKNRSGGEGIRARAGAPVPSSTGAPAPSSPLSPPKDQHAWSRTNSPLADQSGKSFVCYNKDSNSFPLSEAMQAEQYRLRAPSQSAPTSLSSSVLDDSLEDTIRISGRTRISMAAGITASRMIQDLKANFVSRGTIPTGGSQDEIEHYGPARRKAAAIINSKCFEHFMAVIIVINLVIVIFETDQVARCYPQHRHSMQDCPYGRLEYPWLGAANVILLGIYTLEAAIKIAVFLTDYFLRVANLFDFVICISGWLPLVIENGWVGVSWLRILRCFRIIKALRFFREIREVQILWVGFRGSMKAMFFGGCMLLAMMIFLSIFLVQYIHPVNSEIDYGEGCDRCSRGFDSVSSATLTLFQQIIAGDAWGQISVPVIEQDPVLGLFLPFVQLIIGVGAMNLILAVIVDAAADARMCNHAQHLKQLVKDQVDRKLHLLQLISSMDQDGNGYVARSAIADAFHNSDHFKEIMTLAAVEEDELFDAVDCISNDEGHISYLRLCELLDHIQAADVRKTVVLSRLRLNRLSDSITERMLAHEKMLKDQTTVLNTIASKISYLLGEKRSIELPIDQNSSLRSAISGNSRQSPRSSKSPRQTGGKCDDDSESVLDFPVTELDRFRKDLLLVLDPSARGLQKASSFETLSLDIQNHFEQFNRATQTRRQQLLDELLRDIQFESTAYISYEQLMTPGERSSAAVAPCSKNVASSSTSTSHQSKLSSQWETSPKRCVHSLQMDL